MLTKSENCLYQDLLEGYDDFYLNSIIPDRVSREEWQKLWQTYKYSSWGKWTTGSGLSFCSNGKHRYDRNRSSVYCT